jgi:predicted nucleotide-binding protein
MEKITSESAKGTIDKQLAKLKSFQEPLSDYVPQWKDRTIRMLKSVIVNEELELFAQIERDTWEEDVLAYEKMLEEIKLGINENPEFFLIQNQLDSPQKPTTGKRSQQKGISNKVFVVHGHDSLAKTEVARTLEKIDLEAIILHEQANEGKTVIEKFERDASQVSFAVILMTPDDIGYPNNKEKEAKARARQNVVLELGYFSGILGRSNVCVLYKNGVELPSDYLGVIYVPFDKEGAWKFNLCKELKQAGLEVDMNKLI